MSIPVKELVSDTQWPVAACYQRKEEGFQVVVQLIKTQLDQGGVFQAPKILHPPSAPFKGAMSTLVSTEH